MAKNDDLPGGTLGERVKKWERESTKNDFEYVCQQQVKSLGVREQEQSVATP